MRRWMRQLLLVGALLGAASSPARDARTTFTVGAYVVESCEVSALPVRSDARCTGIASRELRGAASSASPNAVVASGAAQGTASAGAGAPAAAPGAALRHAASQVPRILLIRF